MPRPYPSSPLLRGAFLLCLPLTLLVSAPACSSSTNTPAGGDGGRAGGAGSPGSAGRSAGGSSEAAGKSSGDGGSGGGGSSAGTGTTAGSNTAGSTTQGGSGSGGEPNNEQTGSEEHGFTIRKPSDKQLDWLCTFNDESEAGYVYVRLLQTGTKQTGLATTPVYMAELAQLSVNGVVSDLMNAQYDFGGGHHNDSLSFEHGGQTHSYYHSSFGFGFRSCQPMDCRNIYVMGSTDLSTEGCGPERSLPEVCVSIEADGTHDPLTDTFMKCPGDST